MEQQQKITNFINSELTPVNLKCDLEKHNRKPPPKCMSDEIKRCSCKDGWGRAAA